jgi:hypothetical protein
VTRAEIRAAMRGRKKQLREALAVQKKVAKERLGENPAVRRARARKRNRRLAIASVLILLACLMRCECERTPPPPAAAVAPPPKKVPPKPSPPVRAQKIEATMKTQRRGEYPSQPRSTESWVDEYRLQVAARSARLAQCFSGAERPGALRWTASVNAESGAVSDHELEGVAATLALSTTQRDCLLRALSNPNYRLRTKIPEGLPTRVSLVIEF